MPIGTVIKSINKCIVLQVIEGMFANVIALSLERDRVKLLPALKENVIYLSQTSLNIMIHAAMPS